MSIKDVQQLHSLLDRQRWTYDEATGGWWLESGMPRFASIRALGKIRAIPVAPRCTADLQVHNLLKINIK